MQERTYLRRRGRATRGQKRALEELLPRYAIRDPLQFPRRAPVGVEIGFGMGQALLSWAEQRPDLNLIGIEVYQPGIGALLLGVELFGKDNVRVMEGEAESILTDAFPAGSIHEVRLFFPDPWPKKRHHKRRIVQPEFVHMLASRLEPGGRLLLATDWQPYAQWMLSVLEMESMLTNLSGPGQFAPRRPTRPTTRFEARGERLGHQVWDLSYQRNRSISESR